MFETQREPVPRVDADELDVAHAFLKFQRHCVLKKAEGLTEEQLRRPLVASGTSMSGSDVRIAFNSNSDTSWLLESPQFTRTMCRSSRPGLGSWPTGWTGLGRPTTWPCWSGMGRCG